MEFYVTENADGNSILSCNGIKIGIGEYLIVGRHIVHTDGKWVFICVCGRKSANYWFHQLQCQGNWELLISYFPTVMVEPEDKLIIAEGREPIGKLDSRGRTNRGEYKDTGADKFCLDTNLLWSIVSGEPAETENESLRDKKSVYGPRVIRAKGFKPQVGEGTVYKIHNDRPVTTNLQQSRLDVYDAIAGARKGLREAKRLARIDKLGVDTSKIIVQSPELPYDESAPITIWGAKPKRRKIATQIPQANESLDSILAKADSLPMEQALPTIPTKVSVKYGISVGWAD